MTSHLRLVVDELLSAPSVPNRGRQDCARCRGQSTCWRGSAQLIAARLYACRIERGIDRDGALRGLIQLVDRAITGTSRAVARATHEPVDDVRRDIERVIYEALTNTYSVGEILSPIGWLFGRYGAVRMWARRTVQDAVQARARLSPYAPPDDSGITRPVSIGQELTLDTDEAVAAEADADRWQDLRLRAFGVIEDGQTLTTAEYRVLKLCLRVATDRGRPLDGLHLYLAQQLGVTRQRVSVIYTAAKTKLVRAVVDEGRGGLHAVSTRA